MEWEKGEERRGAGSLCKYMQWPQPVLAEAGPQALEPFSAAFLGGKKGAGSVLEPLRLELVLVWDVGVTVVF